MCADITYRNIKTDKEQPYAYAAPLSNALHFQNRRAAAEILVPACFKFFIKQTANKRNIRNFGEKPAPKISDVFYMDEKIQNACLAADVLHYVVCN